MFYPHASSPGADQLPGFEEARQIMWCYEARARVHERMASTPFLEDPEVFAVHVDNTARADRVQLSAYNMRGELLSGFTLYVDTPQQHLDVTPEFDHDFTHLTPTAGSDLEAAIKRENGWVIDMTVLREHDIAQDRVATQRRVFLAHLGDMMAGGQVQGFSLGGALDDDIEDSGAA